MVGIWSFAQETPRPDRSGFRGRGEGVRWGGRSGVARCRLQSGGAAMSAAAGPARRAVGWQGERGTRVEIQPRSGRPRPPRRQEERGPPAGPGLQGGRRGRHKVMRRGALTWGRSWGCVEDEKKTPKTPNSRDLGLAASHGFPWRRSRPRRPPPPPPPSRPPSPGWCRAPTNPSSARLHSHTSRTLTLPRARGSGRQGCTHPGPRTPPRRAAPSTLTAESVARPTQPADAWSLNRKWSSKGQPRPDARSWPWTTATGGTAAPSHRSVRLADRRPTTLSRPSLKRARRRLPLRSRDPERISARCTHFGLMPTEIYYKSIINCPLSDSGN